MSNTWDELRDIADKIERLVHEHPATGMVHQEVDTLIDHIRAKARVHELNAAGLGVTRTSLETMRGRIV